jgi:hypothetical protein
MSFHRLTQADLEIQAISFMSFSNSESEENLDDDDDRRHYCEGRTPGRQVVRPLLRRGVGRSCNGLGDEPRRVALRCVGMGHSKP